MTGDKATERWRFIELKTDCGRAFRIGSGAMLDAGRGCCIIYDDYPGRPDNKQKANAELIVRSVNNYEKLYEIADRMAEQGVALQARAIPSPHRDYVMVRRDDWTQFLSVLSPFRQFQKEHGE